MRLKNRILTIVALFVAVTFVAAQTQPAPKAEKKHRTEVRQEKGKCDKHKAACEKKDGKCCNGKAKFAKCGKDRKCKGEYKCPKDKKCGMKGDAKCKAEGKPCKKEGECRKGEAGKCCKDGKKGEKPAPEQPVRK